MLTGTEEKRMEINLEMLTVWNVFERSVDVATVMGLTLFLTRKLSEMKAKKVKFLKLCYSLNMDHRKFSYS